MSGVPLLARKAQPSARLMWRRSRGSTLMRSPWLTKSGTWTTAPVSSFAGLVTFETVSPFTPGSVSMTVSSTEAGICTPDGWPLTSSIWMELDGCMNSSASSTVDRGRFVCSYVSSSMNTTSSPAS
jgi:hypothetical protein